MRLVLAEVTHPYKKTFRIFKLLPNNSQNISDMNTDTDMSLDTMKMLIILMVLLIAAMNFKLAESPMRNNPLMYAFGVIAVMSLGYCIATTKNEWSVINLIGFLAYFWVYKVNKPAAVILLAALAAHAGQLVYCGHWHLVPYLSWTIATLWIDVNDLKK